MSLDILFIIRGKDDLLAVCSVVLAIEQRCEVVDVVLVGRTGDVG